mmetsp:Transcript_23466/g.63345  ORF Transcript_23466/g.63345 Transcript_23466/m.63345 type:complete len:103 (-) Transcript_23466:240-548(-)
MLQLAGLKTCRLFVVQCAGSEPTVPARQVASVASPRLQNQTRQFFENLFCFGNLVHTPQDRDERCRQCVYALYQFASWRVHWLMRPITDEWVVAPKNLTFHH